MDVAEISAETRRTRARFAQFEVSRYGRAWTPEEIMLGLVGDVKDLAKLVQSAAGVRAIPDLDDKSAHEIADCLWAVFALAQAHQVDLEAAFTSTIGQLDAWLDEAETTS